MVKVQEPGKLTILEPMEATEQTERCMIHLDDNIYVVAKMYDEALQIYIRQYNQFGDKLYPSKKGVVLNLSRWLLLEVNLAKIDQHVKIPIDDSHHLGGGGGVCLNSRYTTINIRHFWKPVGASQALPTKRSIVLKKVNWEWLKHSITLIRDYVPELNDAHICQYSEDHTNVMGMLTYQ
jgi:hypothetical protein